MFVSFPRRRRSAAARGFIDPNRTILAFRSRDIRHTTRLQYSALKQNEYYANVTRPGLRLTRCGNNNNNNNNDEAQCTERLPARAVLFRLVERCDGAARRVFLVARPNGLIISSGNKYVRVCPTTHAVVRRNIIAANVEFVFVCSIVPYTRSAANRIFRRGVLPSSFVYSFSARATNVPRRRHRRMSATETRPVCPPNDWWSSPARRNVAHD